MTLAILFWILYIIGLIFGYWTCAGQPFKSWGGGILFWVLIGLLGWKVFGPPIQ